VEVRGGKGLDAAQKIFQALSSPGPLSQLLLNLRCRIFKTSLGVIVEVKMQLHFLSSILSNMKAKKGAWEFP
jgi:hypothetical protein